MNGAGDELFSSSSLPLDQHAGICARHDLHLLQHMQQQAACADDLRKVRAVADLILEVNLFDTASVFEVSEFSVDGRMLYGDCDLARHLPQEIDFVPRVGDFLPFAEYKNAQDLVPN